MIAASAQMEPRAMMTLHPRHGGPARSSLSAFAYTATILPRSRITVMVPRPCAVALSRSA
ncbi:Hypothetical protein A7982_11772 [Minicystis rosea]|nr:Hypothetical protein A7982_11772 [Minicystis rosea]